MSDESRHSEKNHYRALDLQEDAGQEEITQRFRRLQLLYQPESLESAADRAYAAQKLAEVEKAYEILGDPARRAIYDGKPAPIVVGSDGEPESLTCANHPDRETLLRCNKCGKPICISCAVRTPVGYRFFIAFIAGSAGGTLVARVIRRAVGNRRGRKLPHWALAGIILGVAPWAFFFLLAGGRAFLMLLLFAGLAIASAFPQLR